MTDTTHDLEAQYRSALVSYLEHGGEAALESAYAVGRKAIAAGWGALEMLTMHQRCLSDALRSAADPQEAVRVSEDAGYFFAESLSPFEMGLRGFQEANAKLTANVENLRSAREELLQQHRALLAAHQALEMEQLRYRDLFDFAPDGYLVTDLASRIEEANRVAEALLGDPSGSLVGELLAEFLSERSRAEFEALLHELRGETVDRARERQFDIRIRRGGTFPALVSVRAVRDTSGAATGLRWLVRDISDRQRIEQERAQLLVREQVAKAQMEAARRFAFLAEAGNLLVASLDSSATLATLARRIVPYLADACMIYLVEGDTGLRLLCETRRDGLPSQYRGASRDGRALVGPEIAQLLREGHAEIFCASTPEYEQFFEEHSEAFSGLTEFHPGSFLLAPMLAQGEPLGLLLLAALDADRFRPGDATLAEDLAHRCALAVDNTRLYRAMMAERDKAAEASRAKDEFLGILGHELRNPLVPILGWSRNLKRHPSIASNPVLHKGVETLERNARNILRLADDCLDLVRISERKVELKQEPLNVNALVEASIEALRLKADEKALRMTVFLQPGNLPVVGDRSRLEQVMTNLLINAIKYTDPGGEIAVRTSGAGGNVEIEIKDTGIGIAEEDLEQIFQPFGSARKAWLKADAGLGLGLAIARKIVEMHGGTIWAESAGLGKGSAFRLRLHLAEAGAAAPPTDQRRSVRVEPPGSVRVLLIDDQPDVTDLIKTDLEALGYTVFAASDGYTGLRVAYRELPDAIVSDIKMPRMDGYELVHSLRQPPELASVPIIALTGLGMKKDVDMAIEAGYDAHLNKPVEAQELSELIQSLLKRRRATGA